MCCTVAMGSYAMEKALSEEAVEKAIVESGAVDQLTDSILKNSTGNMGGQWGETMKTILKSQAMTDFFSAYTAACLQSQISGEEPDAIGEDAMNQAFQQGIDECIANGSISMGEFERKAFDVALNLAMPALTSGINVVMEQLNLTSFVDPETAEKIETVQQITKPETRYAAIGLAVIICLLLLVLFWRSKAGLIWCGVVILLVAGLFELLSMALGKTVESTDGLLVLSTQMLYIMVSYGVQKIAVIGAIAGGICFPLCPVLRLISK